MSIQMETSVITPNSIFVPMIILQTGINKGKLQTSCQITLAASKVENEGTENEFWTSTSQQKTVYIPDLDNLEPDLQSENEQVVNLRVAILQFITFINNTRKVL